MNKDEFFKLERDKQGDLVVEALVNVIMFEELAPHMATSMFKKENLEVVKIVLGAFMNGKIN